MCTKSIILTYAPVSEDEKSILINTDIYKLALNQHAGEYLPHARILADYILPRIYRSFDGKIISVRDKSIPESGRVEYFKGEFKGSTIIAAVDYLISKGFEKVLIVGNNQVNNMKFRNEVSDEIDKIKDKIKLYQYSKGNFNLPVMSVADFCSK